MWYLTIIWTLMCILLLSGILFLIVIKFWADSLRNSKCKCKTSLVGKVALVTGGNSGIGLETARDLARRGAKVIIASRNTVKSEEAVKDIKNTTGNDNIEFRYLDLSKFSEVRKFAKAFNDENERLDILVNNAGCALLRKQVTEDGIIKVMQVNYVAQFLLTNLLLDKLIQSKPSRIVNVSSCFHKLPTLNLNDIATLKINCPWNCYSISKLCQVLWTKALAKRLPKDVIVNSLHPGLVKTDIFLRLHPLCMNICLIILDLFFKTPEEGAQTVIHLCVSPGVVGSGDYYKDLKICRPAKAAFNSDLIEKVWNETENLVEKAMK